MVRSSRSRLFVACPSRLFHGLRPATASTSRPPCIASSGSTTRSGSPSWRSSGTGWPPGSRPRSPATPGFGRGGTRSGPGRSSASARCGVAGDWWQCFRCGGRTGRCGRWRTSTPLCSRSPHATIRRARSAFHAALEAAPGALEIEALAATDSALPALAHDSRGAGRLPLVETVHTSPIIDLQADFAAYRKLHPSRCRKLLKLGRKMLRDYEAEVALMEVPENLDAELDRAFELEAAGWKGVAGTAMASAEETARFYRSVANAYQRPRGASPVHDHPRRRAGGVRRLPAQLKPPVDAEGLLQRAFQPPVARERAAPVGDRALVRAGPRGGGAARGTPRSTSWPSPPASASTVGFGPTPAVRRRWLGSRTAAGPGRCCRTSYRQLPRQRPATEEILQWSRLWPGRGPVPRRSTVG